MYKRQGDNINQILDKDSVLKHLDSSDKPYKVGKAEIIRGGNDATIITYGAMLHVALKAAEIMSLEEKEIEIIDLRTILPYDAERCVKSVNRSGIYMVLQEAQYSCGFGHTISSRIQEEVFYHLESAPVILGALDTPVPFSPTLEDHTIPDVDLVVTHLRNLCFN